MTAAVADQITLSRRERREYSIAAAILSAAVGERSGLAFDIDQQLRADYPDLPRRSDEGFLVPYAALDANLTRAGLDTATSTKGAEVTFTTGRTWVDMFRIQTVVLRAGATLLTNLRGNVGIPYIGAAETVSSVAQNPGGNTATSAVTMGQATMTPSTLQSVTQFSRQLLALSTVVPDNAVDRIVAKSMAAQHAVQADTLLLGGTGASNQPTGVATQLAGAQLIAFGTNGAQPTWANLVAIENAVANANAMFPEFDAAMQDTQPPMSAWIVSPTMRARLRQQDRGGVTTTGRFLLESDRMFSTYPVFVSNAIPQALTKGTSSGTCQAILFGVWENLYVGMWGPGLELIVDPYSLKKQGEIEVASFQLFGLAMARSGAFAGSLDALP